VHAGLKRRALPWSRQLAGLFLDRVFEPPQVLRATAYVMGDLPSAANFCRRVGFTDEGVRRNAIVKGGRILDCIVLGLLRSEWLERRGA
jgi:RimJ/RimL family protein N-acetyltransferase